LPDPGGITKNNEKAQGRLFLMPQKGKEPICDGNVHIKNIRISKTHDMMQKIK
jgi:hypothetical protein